MPHKLNQMPVYTSCVYATYPTTFSLRHLTTNHKSANFLARVSEFSRDFHVTHLAY